MFYLLSGIPGSGKTTLAHKLAEQHNAQVCSYDEMPNANIKVDGSVMEAWLASIRSTLQSGKSVVCDAINLTVEERKRVLSVVADIPCKKVLYVKVVPLETCLQRNRERKARLPDFVIEQAAKKMEAPSKNEGWDSIYLCRE